MFVSGGYRRRRAYLYPNLSDIYHFGMLNLEQQADLLAHYYASCYLKGNIYNAQNQTFQKILKVVLSTTRAKKNGCLNAGFIEKQTDLKAFAV